MTRTTPRKRCAPAFACINPRARDAHWIVAFCNCDTCKTRREKQERENLARAERERERKRIWLRG